jgi:hypothetical protein
MTMSDDGHSPTGIAHYWKCGRPAKATIIKFPGKGKMFVCGIHAKAHDKTALKLKTKYGINRQLSQTLT